MMLRIVDTNFLSDKDWIFELTDDANHLYYILDAAMYKDLGIKTPISKKHLDCYQHGHEINADISVFSGRNIVISILE